MTSWWKWLVGLLTEPASYENASAERTRTVLRWLMAFLVVGLGSAVLYQRWNSAADCFQVSISAYYYTPAQAIFVGALVSIGVCLLAVKGKTAAEDAMLNFAGILAPIVAIVPTPPPVTASCDIPAGQGGQRAVDVANNMPALFVVGILTLGLAVVLVYRPVGGAPRGNRSEQVAVWAAVLLWVVAVVVFVTARQTFLDTAHYTAAITMFAAIFAVVWINALLVAHAPDGSWRNRYTLVAVLMVVVGVATIAAGLAGWDHWVIGIETGLITLFAVFWVAQTSASQRQMIRTGDATSAIAPDPVA